MSHRYATRQSQKRENAAQPAITEGSRNVLKKMADSQFQIDKKHLHLLQIKILKDLYIYPKTFSTNLLCMRSIKDIFYYNCEESFLLLQIITIDYYYHTLYYFRLALPE